MNNVDNYKRPQNYVAVNYVTTPNLNNNDGITPHSSITRYWVSMKASPILLHIPVSSAPNSKCLSSIRNSVNLNLLPTSTTSKNLTGNDRSTRRVSAVEELSAVASDPIQGEVTWEIVVGTLAGVTPFVVAGIEFSKRIVAQKNCRVCGGSGLVLRDNKYYFRCPRCGGFLPWQSWKRFFSG